VITLGRNARGEGLLASEEELARAGLILRRIERGGQATYHGPGQVVGYPIIDLHGLGIGVAAYVRNLEQVMIRTAAAFGVEARAKEKITGVFTEQGKLGAIGVRVTRGITYHGFAFNVDPRIEHYRFIVPCGMTGIDVTSLRALRSGEELGMSEVRSVIVDAFGEVFGYETG
jgi:lipoate-protein ligase B